MANRNKDDFENAFEKPFSSIRRKGKSASFEVLFAFVLIWAVLVTLFCVYLVLFEGGFQEKLQNQHDTSSVNVTSEELELKLITAKEEARAEFLQELKDKMLTGNGSVSMLRDFFPEEIIYLKDGEYKFYPISDTLKKNPYTNISFRQEEETKILEAFEDSKSVSRFGIDVSKHNGEINWDIVGKTEVSFAFIRLGYRGYGTGKLALDDQYINNMEGIKQTGIDVGVYFFTQAISEEEAVEEAEFLLANIEDYNLDLPIVIDVEKLDVTDPRTKDLTVEERTDFCIAFCKRIEAEGYETIIYGNLITFMELLDITRLEEYKKWFAFYDNAEYYYPYDFDIWQYSESGLLDGVNEKVDFNVFFEKEKITEQ